MDLSADQVLARVCLRCSMRENHGGHRPQHDFKISGTHLVKEAVWVSGRFSGFLLGLGNLLRGGFVDFEDTFSDLMGAGVEVRVRELAFKEVDLVFEGVCEHCWRLFVLIGRRRLVRLVFLRGWFLDGLRSRFLLVLGLRVGRFGLRFLFPGLWLFSLGLRILFLGLRVLCLGLRVLCLGFWLLCLGLCFLLLWLSIVFLRRYFFLIGWSFILLWPRFLLVLGL